MAATYSAVAWRVRCRCRNREKISVNGFLQLRSIVYPQIWGRMKRRRGERRGCSLCLWNVSIMSSGPEEDAGICVRCMHVLMWRGLFTTRVARGWNGIEKKYMILKSFPNELEVLALDPWATPGTLAASRTHEAAVKRIFHLRTDVI